MLPIRSTSIAIAGLAGAVMIFELALIRVFSFVSWYHFASMVISVALLGFGASGVVLARRPSWGRPARPRAALYGGLFGATGLGAVWAVSRVPFDLLKVTVDAGEAARLLLLYLILTVPFTFAGLAIATLLGGFTARAGLLYGCDLMGAALGCLVMVAATARLGVEGMIVAASALAAASACLLAVPDPGGSWRSARVWGAVAALLALLVPWAADILVIEAGPGKVLFRYMKGDDVRLAFTRWSALFRTDVIEGGPPVPWTANATARVAPPQQHQILIDGDALTPMIRLDGDAEEESAFLDYMLPSLGLQALAPGRVLVIGAGGGADVLAALHHGARRVDAVEINSDIVQLVTETYADWNHGLFLDGRVSLHHAEGRSFVRRSPEEFDLVQLSLVDTWASSAAGAYSLAEGYLYTVEAFADYLTHLTEGGVVSVSRWLHSPPRETLRVVTVAASALERLGVENPGAHIVVATSGRVSNTLVKRSPFTENELRRLLSVGQRRYFDFLYLPGAASESSVIAEFLNRADRLVFYDEYRFDVTPTTDERPFFFQFLRWGQVRSADFSGKGLLLLIFVQALVLSVVILVLPTLTRTKEKTAGAGATMGYFLLLGIAFMLVEIVLMQRFTLYLGHPIYGIALVLAGLLVGAGSGSLSAARLVPRGSRPEAIFGALIVVTALYAMVLPWVLQATLGWALLARVALAVVMILPLAFLLGVPFPTALASLAGGDGSQVARAWAANGCGSVLGPLLAVILALDLGYGRVMLIAALLYAVAYAVFRDQWAASTDPPSPAA